MTGHSQFKEEVLCVMWERGLVWDSFMLPAKSRHKHSSQAKRSLQVMGKASSGVANGLSVISQ